MLKIENSELGRLSVDEFKSKKKREIVVVCDNIRSLNNIGSIFRSSDAFAFEMIYLCGISATPPNKEIHKTALGAELSVEWKYEADTKDAVATLIEQGYTPVCVEQVQGAIMLDEYIVDRGKKYALIFGNEVRGVSQDVVDMCSHAIEIPQEGTKHSLNVSVAAGVVMWHFFCAK